MNILIIDRDQLSSQLLSSRIEALDNTLNISEISVKNDAMERLANESFDLVIIDPAPMNDAQALVMNIRRTARSYVYIVVQGENIQLANAIKSGANDCLPKPVDVKNVEAILKQAGDLQRSSYKLNDLSEDFPSAGGVIAKSAFNQLFLSAIDRSWRYAESTHVLSVSIDNYDEIEQLDGNYHAQYGISKLAHYLVNLRRQSDIIGQTGRNEYCLLLQRVVKESEAEEAAKRFAASIEEINDFVPAEGSALKIRVALMELPTGYLLFDRTILKQAQ